MKIIKFSAIWCSACLIMNKIWKEIEKDYDIDLVSYDLDMDEEEAEKYNIGEKLPEVILLDEKGKELKRLIGEHKKEEIIEFLGLDI